MDTSAICWYCGVGHPGMSCSEAVKADWKDLIYPEDQTQEQQLKRYPPTDLEEATRALRPDEYCASCGYQHKGWPGASCGQP